MKKGKMAPCWNAHLRLTVVKCLNAIHGFKLFNHEYAKSANPSQGVLQIKCKYGHVDIFALNEWVTS